MKSEGEKWEELMVLCREASRLLGRKFEAPKYQNWRDAQAYYAELQTDLDRKFS